MVTGGRLAFTPGDQASTRGDIIYLIYVLNHNPSYLISNNFSRRSFYMPHFTLSTDPDTYSNIYNSK